MIQNKALIAFLLATAGAFPATAATVPPGPHKAERSDAGLSAPVLQLAQDRDVEVYFDGRGNRVIVDSYTGEVIAIEPRRLNRQAQRRYDRQRELGRIRAYEQRDDFTAVERPRRLEAYPGDGPVIEGPVDEWAQDPDVPDFTRPGSRGRAERLDDYAEPDFGGSRDRDADYSEDSFPEPPVAPAESLRPRRVERAPLPRAPADEVAVNEPPSLPSAAEPQTTGSTQPADAVPSAAADPAAPPPLNFTVREDVAAVQVLLDRAGASPGVIDGKFGSNVDKAFVAYRELTGTNLKSTDTEGIKQALARGGGGAFMDYTITPEDAAGPFVAAVPTDYGEKAKLEHMSYTSVTEMLAERFHMDEAYLKAANPDANFNRPGTIIRVANTGANVSTKVARIVADKGRKQVRAYSADNRLVAAYPATIGSSDTPSPTGTHAVSRVAFNPNYTYNPKLNFKQGENDKVLTIPPGPNGPVGSLWIALDKPTYGIHGTPDPSKIGKTESHGCVRLTNWDAEELARLVTKGVTVEFVE